MVTYDYMKMAQVYFYDQSLGATMQKIVDSAVVYDGPSTGQVIISIKNQALHVPENSNNLLNNMQLRLNDVKINECPKFLADIAAMSAHTIVVDQDGSKYTIHLDLEGVISAFNCRTSTQQEYDNCYHINLMNKNISWDPHDPEQQECERKMLEEHRICNNGYQYEEFIKKNVLPHIVSEVRTQTVSSI